MEIWQEIVYSPLREPHELLILVNIYSYQAHDIYKQYMVDIHSDHNNLYL